MAERLHVFIKGRVQGVGFRYGVHARAVELGLRGWTRNLPDGRVEAVFEGAPDDLTEMLAWCQHGPRFARVVEALAEWSDATGAFERFEVR